MNLNWNRIMDFLNDVALPRQGRVELGPTEVASMDASQTDQN